MADTDKETQGDTETSHGTGHDTAAEKTVDLMGKLKAPMTITAPTWAYSAAGFLVLLLVLAALD